MADLGNTTISGKLAVSGTGVIGGRVWADCLTTTQNSAYIDFITVSGINFGVYGTAGTVYDLSPLKALKTVATSGSYTDLTDKPNILLLNNAATWTWGSLTTANGYTQLGSYNESEGGSVAFAAKGGMTSIQIDGRYYDQEGKYQLVDTNDLSTTLTSYVLTTDSRLSDSRKASDVYDWAKKSTLSGAINTLSTGDSTPVDADYFISQYVNGGTTTTTYHRRPVSCLWNYIKSKLATVATSGSYTDLTNKPTIPTVNNGTLTMQVEGTTKTTFSANQSNTATFNITSSDLGLSQALKFIGKFDSLPTASDYAVGNVVLVGSKEYVLIETSGTKTWDEMGDESSHALNTITITGTGALGGGGNLQSNRIITHNTVTRTNNTSTSAPGFGGTFTTIDSVTSDSYGHITAVNTKTVTIPSAVATTSAAGLMSATDKTNLNNKVSKSGDTLACGATFAFANSGNWQASGDSNVGVTFPYSCGGFTWSDQSDGISLYGEATGNDNLDLVIKFTDDNSNKLSIRNASGTQVGYLHANGSMGFNSIYEGGTALSSKYSPLAGSSSLTTCSKGTFGAAATYSATTTVTSGSSALVTSDAVYQAIYGAMNTAV